MADDEMKAINTHLDEQGQMMNRARFDEKGQILSVLIPTRIAALSL